MHSAWLEAAVLCLVSVELISTLVEISIHEGYLCLYGGPAGHHDIPHTAQLCELASGPRTQSVMGILDTVGAVILRTFAVEMALKVFVGRRGFFANPLHVLDFLTILANFAIAYIEEGLEESSSLEELSSLLLCVRFWRMAKFVKLIGEERGILAERAEEARDERVRAQAIALCRKHGVPVKGSADVEGGEDSAAATAGAGMLHASNAGPRQRCNGDD